MKDIESSLEGTDNPNKENETIVVVDEEDPSLIDEEEEEEAAIAALDMREIEDLRIKAIEYEESRQFLNGQQSHQPQNDETPSTTNKHTPKGQDDDDDGNSRSTMKKDTDDNKYYIETKRHDDVSRLEKTKEMGHGNKDESSHFLSLHSAAGTTISGSDDDGDTHVAASQIPTNLERQHGVGSRTPGAVAIPGIAGAADATATTFSSAVSNSMSQHGQQQQQLIIEANLVEDGVATDDLLQRVQQLEDQLRRDERQQQQTSTAVVVNATLQEGDENDDSVSNNTGRQSNNNDDKRRCFYAVFLLLFVLIIVAIVAIVTVSIINKQNGKGGPPIVIASSPSPPTTVIDDLSQPPTPVFSSTMEPSSSPSHNENPIDTILNLIYPDKTFHANNTPASVTSTIDWMTNNDELILDSTSPDYQWLLVERFVVVKLFYDWRGFAWNNQPQTNWLSVDTHICDWNRLVCNLNDRLITIELEGNNVRGRLPTEIGMLNRLQELLLGGNNIWGG